MKAKYVVVSALLGLAVMGARPASAENACKGLSESACGAAAGCGWVQGYTRKDGRAVAPYCRTKGKDKSEVSAASGKGARPEG
jgi:hypothetical protein